MIQEDYVSLDVAKLLKEKGFDDSLVPVNYGFNTYNELTGVLIINNPPGTILAPTLQMAIKWLREKKCIAIIPIISSILDFEKFLWDIKIVVSKPHNHYYRVTDMGWIYEKQENACNAAIKYCLENLI